MKYLLFPFALMVAVLVLIALAIAWVFGTEISIKRHDRVVGYLRWFKYRRVVMSRPWH